MQKHAIIPVWFFAGLLLALYGVLICGSGIWEWSRPSHTVLGELHAPVWWGALLALIGTGYCIAFWPKRH
jgi:hypothetical protein